MGLSRYHVFQNNPIKKENFEKFLEFDSEEMEDYKKCKIKSRLSFYWKERECKTCGDPNKFGFRFYIKPPKVSHCNFCNNCVLGFDHHCVLLNNCIGRRNLKFFSLFLFISFTASIFLSICSLVWIHYQFYIHSKIYDDATF